MSNRYGDKYRVHNLVKFDYSQIGEYIDEFHTDRPLRNDELVDLLNEQNVRIKELESENKMLKTTINRNEAYIKRVTTKGKWSNTGDVQ